MAIDNDELMSKFVRTGMIMRHIDGEGSRCGKRGHGRGECGGPGGHGHGDDGCGGREHGGHGRGRCGHGGHGHGGHGGQEGYAQSGEPAGPGAAQGENAKAFFEMGPDARLPHGPHGHGPDGRIEDGPIGHGPDGYAPHGHGPHDHGCGPHGHGRGHHGKKRRGQARVLTMVSMQEGISQKDLAFLLGVRPQTLGEMLQKLEERGLVVRQKSETDKRVIEVSLTEEGRQRAEEIAERRKLAAADMFSVLSEEEKEQLSTILDKLDAELESHRPPHCKKRKDAEEGTMPSETIQA